MWKVKLWRTYVKTDNDGFTFDILFFLLKRRSDADEIQSYLIKKSRPFLLGALGTSSKVFLATISVLSLSTAGVSTTPYQVLN